MKPCSLSSKQYPGVQVSYTYCYEPEQVRYSSRGEFNGGTPAHSEIDLLDVKAGGLSIYELLSETAVDTLKEEIADSLSIF